MKQLNIPYIAGGVIVVAITLLYLITLDTGLRPDELTGGDLITHQYAQVEARPSNAPGYPLYTMGGWLWFQVGQVLLSWTLNPIQILSFYSTLWGLASLVVLYLILLHITNRENLALQWLIPLLLTAFYATTFFFWYYSVTTEQYTSAVFQTLLLIWLAFRWDDSSCDSTLLWLAFISGSMLANMVTTLFILPSLLWFIFFRQNSFLQSPANFRRWMLFTYLKRPKLVLQAVGATFLPLLGYIYIFIRGAQHPEWQGVGNWSSTWDWFVQFITIQQGRDELAPGLTLNHIFTAEFPALMGQELTWIIFWGGLVGLSYLGRRRAIFLYSTLMIYFIFSWGYRFGNWFQVIIPAYPIFIIGFAAGLQQIQIWAGQRIRLWQGFITLLLIGLIIYSFSVNFPQANQHNLPIDTGLDPGWAIVANNPDSQAVIVTDFEERVALEYLQAVWQIKPDIKLIDTIADFTDQNTRQLYTSRRAVTKSPELLQTKNIYPQAAGEQLIALSSAPLTQLPLSAIPLNLVFGDTLQLSGWKQINPNTHLPANVAKRLPQSNWQVALYWQTSAKLDADYTISIRPLVAGQLVMNGESAIIQDHQPVWGMYPTSQWHPNELVRDVYALTLPDDTMPDVIQIVVYKTTNTGFENLGDQSINLRNQ